MSNKNVKSHTVKIEVKPNVTEIEVSAPDPIKTSYIEKYLTRKEFASAKTYIYPDALNIVRRMVKMCGNSQATIGGYISEILLEHFRQNRELMQSIFDDNKEELF